MWAQLVLLSFSFPILPDTPFSIDHCCCQRSSTATSCETEFDSLTESTVYSTADVLPRNEGGKSALMRRLSKITIERFPPDYDPNFLVAFVIDTDGKIKGERIVKDKTNVVGQQMLAIVKAFKWTPARCRDKNVAMLYKLPLIIDAVEQ